MNGLLIFYIVAGITTLVCGRRAYVDVQYNSAFNAWIRLFICICCALMVFDGILYELRG